MVSVIVAVASNGAIGCANKLLWHISEDLRRFKAITSGHPVVMGRKTFESIGKPLPGRTNVVITRNGNYSAPGVSTAGSLEEAIGMFPESEEVFIIGGAEIYSQAMPIADKFYLTVVERDYEGDTFFPQWDKTEWRETFRQEYPRGEKFEYPFVFTDHVRK